MFKKLFHLPTPKELGKSKYNALPLKSFTPWTKDYTWEDHDAYLKETYPVKFFLAKEMPDFIKYNCYYPIARPISNGWYWLKCHLLPKHRYHFLDLRQPHNEDCIDDYQYGWADVVSKILYANFNLLKEYFDEEPYDLRKDYSQEEIDADVSMSRQQHVYDEAKTILHWWQVERKTEVKYVNELRRLWCDAKDDDIGPDDPETLSYWNQLNEAEAVLEAKTEEMLIRLIKIRNSLWT